MWMENQLCVQQALCRVWQFYVCKGNVACRCNCLVCRTCGRRFWRFSLTVVDTLLPHQHPLSLSLFLPVYRYTSVPHTFTINQNQIDRKKKKEVEESSFHLVASLSLLCVYESVSSVSMSIGAFVWKNLINSTRVPLFFFVFFFVVNCASLIYTKPKVFFFLCFLSYCFYILDG